MKLLTLLAAAAATAAAMDAASLRVRSHHHGAHLKFQETEVIAVNATCPNGGAVLLCADAAYECQDDGTGTQRCLPRAEAFLDEIDDSTTMPWAACSTSDTSLPSKCLFDFTCLCMDTANADCYCMPPDAYRLNRGAAAEGCTTANGTTNACDPGKYCRTKGSAQECAAAPYLPGIQLYGECTGAEDTEGVCAAGLTCEAFNDFFSMCVSSA